MRSEEGDEPMTVEEMKKKKSELGFSCEQISARSGVPLGTVQKIFSGITKRPRYDFSCWHTNKLYFYDVFQYILYLFCDVSHIIQHIVCDALHNKPQKERHLRLSNTLFYSTLLTSSTICSFVR